MRLGERRGDKEEELRLLKKVLGAAGGEAYEGVGGLLRRPKVKVSFGR